MLSPGETVDRYTVDALLGEGGMAVVYRVHHTTLNTTHALKLLKVFDAGIQQRLVREGQMQSALRSDNVVSVTDVISFEGSPALLLEYVDGPSLEEWLAENRVTVPAALAIFRGILAGVACAHRAGIVHRDLKPGNVLLCPADGAVVPKVTDFGLAKALQGSGAVATRSGTGLGTPNFMAPEQIRNAKDVDRRADIFSLGCILYCLVCQRRPFDQPSEVELYGAICAGTYEDPQTARPDLPDAVAAAIRGCLVVDVASRVESCEALHAMLFSGEGEVFRAPAVKLGGRKLRSPTPSTKLIPAETRLPGEAASAPLFRRPAPQPSAAPAPARQEPATSPVMIGGLVVVAVGGLVASAAVGVIVWAVLSG